ncbi:hypothetical protein, partial [Neisseria gonorrhoeae]
LYGQQVRIGNHSEKIRRANRCRLKPRVSGGIFTKAHQPEEKRGVVGGGAAFGGDKKPYPTAT